MNSKKNIKGRSFLQSFTFSLLIVAFVLLSACDYNRRTTGWQYFEDMVTSPAYESYTANPNFADGKTMQPPVPGTIPRGMVPYAYEKTDEDRVLAAATLVNELENNKTNLQRGEKMYGVYCMQCHGDTGDGQGPLYVNKKYTYPPASLLSEKMLASPEGDIYHVITVGHGIMAEHGSMIRPEDRWKIAMYVKEVLQK
ncbi:cytochrome c [uncultured Draconibacterium sp.]|uniref:c-type cytochrome n=1 Tax=uncultured Draconibacterium sp. TaxID=1573823 RepID=UPI0025D99372|nr:cytochrome c [uncultured Draconibacterium sp.]